MTNERLRQYVSEVLFQQEQAECLQEGIAMETPRSPSNQPIILDFFLQVLWFGPVQSRLILHDVIEATVELWQMPHTQPQISSSP